MRKNVLSFILIFVVIINAQHLFAQEAVVSGKVTDGAEPLAGVNILIKDKVSGTITDVDGNFKLRVADGQSATLIFSMVGFKSQEYSLSSGQSEISIVLEEAVLIGNEVVISASRVEESILESPVSIEKMDIRDIREAPAVTFYDALSNIKGVDVSTQSLTFQSVNARGFGANGNERFVQLIDGIDNQAPGLNFPVGNIVGISELDLESVELIPGASSALYGPNAINGILLMTSKSPFDYQGASVDVRIGVNHVDGRDDEAGTFQRAAFRYAKAYNDKLAFKVNGSVFSANDFVGVDERDQTGFNVERNTNTRETSRTYDGVNIYGDPVINLASAVEGIIQNPNSDPALVGQLSATQSQIPFGSASDFSPRGYAERDFVSNEARSVKLNTAIHYRFNDNLEWINQFNYGTGNSVFTGNDRYVFDGFFIWNAKTELKGSNFFLRAYVTKENSGDSYASNLLASRMNLASYVPNYLSGFIGAKTGQIGGQATGDNEVAHAIARQFADSQHLLPGTPGFNQLFDSLRNITIDQGGGKFLDKTSLYQAEGMYNLSKAFNDEVEVIVGGNVRRYNLNSEGTLFALQDNGDEYNITEYGGYLQAKKKVFSDKLTLSASVRYDKNQFFTGQFSPRFSAVYKAGENHFFRASIQRGFRMPTTQDQFIDLDIVSFRLIGSNEDLVERYKLRENTPYTALSLAEAREILATTGDEAQARAALKPFDVQEFETEKITTFEIGYKSNIDNKLFIDAYYYQSVYTDFITGVSLVQAIPNGLRGAGSSNPTGDSARDSLLQGLVPLQAINFDVNADQDVRVRGAAIGIDYLIGGGYSIGANLSYNDLINEADLVNEGLQRNFNSPKYRYNIKFGNREFVKNYGFNITYKWQDAFIWQSAIGSGVVPSFGTLDAQLSHKLKVAKSIIKVGGANILNKRYVSSFANPSLGAMYYIGITFDEFLN